MNNRGFSLVELVIVIAILGLMLTLLAPMYTKYIFTSQASTDVQNLQQIKTAVEVYYSENSPQSAGKFVVEIEDDNFKITSADKDKIISNAGLTEPIKMKSKMWNDFKMEYDPASNEWSITGKNSVDTEKYDLSNMTQ